MLTTNQNDMAIVLKEQKRKANWFAIIVFLFLLVVILITAYFLFFASVPGIETIAPTSLKSVSQISREAELFDPTTIVSDPVLKTLRQYGGLPSTGNLGRSNPFAPLNP